MQQVSTHTLRALILSALLTTSGMAFAATPAQTPSATPAQHTVTTTATVQDTTTTAQNKTAVPANTVVNQQLRPALLRLQRISKMCDHTSSPMYQVIFGLLNQLVP